MTRHVTLRTRGGVVHLLGRFLQNPQGPPWFIDFSAVGQAFGNLGPPARCQLLPFPFWGRVSLLK